MKQASKREGEMDDLLTGDLEAYTHILDCMYRTCETKQEDVYEMVLNDILRSDLLSLGNLKKHNNSSMIKLFRGLFSSGCLDVKSHNFKKL